MYELIFQLDSFSQLRKNLVGLSRPLGAQLEQVDCPSVKGAPVLSQPEQNSRDSPTIIIGRSANLFAIIWATSQVSDIVKVEIQGFSVALKTITF
jgi:hypothetical protein